jgi:hypothetical protein
MRDGNSISLIEADRATLDGKFVVGFQGWFMCPGDARGKGGWWHWFTANKPDAEHVHFDVLPDVSEFAPEELCATDLRTVDGRPVALFSDQHAGTVLRQFVWMQQYSIESVALQRFLVDIDPSHPVVGHPAVDRVLVNVRAAAEATGRAFFVMYDIAGADSETWPQTLADDWRALVGSGLTASSAYQRHRKRPVVAIAGIGSRERPGTPEQVTALLRRLRSETPGGVTIFGSTASGWRTLDGDAKPDPGWAAAYRAFDILSPWTVGRYRDRTSYGAFLASRIIPDMKAARDAGLEYMPVAFPGFSWHNLFHSTGRSSPPLDAIPRDCGRFLWMQAVGATNAGARMLYGAMFDEVDEGTALFKLVPDRRDLPLEPPMVGLDTDSCHLSSDWYLRLSGAIGKLMRGDIAPAADLPIALPNAGP